MDHIELLEKTLDIRLEVQAREVGVGPFRADIVCKDLNNPDVDACVLIENQLERSNHTQLGQIITYASGLSAGTIIWIAEEFTDPHRAAVDWLNKNTPQGIDFFAVEIEVWKIGDSLPAPKLNLACQPNEWSKTRNLAESDLKRLQVDYWTAFGEHLEKMKSRFRLGKPQAHSMTVERWGRAVRLCVWARAAGRNGAGIVIEGDGSTETFDGLAREKDGINQALGAGELDWHRNEVGKHMCRIETILRHGGENRENWPEQFTWLESKLEAFTRVLKPRLGI